MTMEKINRHFVPAVIIDLKLRNLMECTNVGKIPDQSIEIK